MSQVARKQREARQATAEALKAEAPVTDIPDGVAADDLDADDLPWETPDAELEARERALTEAEPADTTAYQVSLIRDVWAFAGTTEAGAWSTFLTREDRDWLILIAPALSDWFDDLAAEANRRPGVNRLVGTFR